MADSTCEVKLSVTHMEPFKTFVGIVCDIHNQLGGERQSSRYDTAGPDMGAIWEQVERLGRALGDFAEATTDDEERSLMDEVATGG